MPSSSPNRSTILPDFESHHTSFHALVSSLVPPSFVGTSRPQLNVEVIKKEERDRRDTERRKQADRDRASAGDPKGSSSKSSSAFPQMSDSTKRKISDMRSLATAIPGPSTGNRRSAENNSSSEDEGESRSSAVKSSKKAKLITESTRKRTKSQIGDNSARNPQSTSALFTTVNTPNSTIDEPAAPATISIIIPISSVSADSPSIPSKESGGGSVPTSTTSNITSTPSSALTKNQRKKWRKKEKKALEVAKTSKDDVPNEERNTIEGS